MPLETYIQQVSLKGHI